jgi:hypothetical protein
MPLFHYLCECNYSATKFYRQAKDAPASLVCLKCGKEQKKKLSSPNSLSKIVIDNGVQARSVEIIPNIIEINEARSSKTYRNEDE